jgi:uncharacterized RDD family membrane protein YckC
MKCPKCGYLGFETTDRCRNCQYDFSLAPFASDPELSLQSADRSIESGGDFDLPAIKRQTDSLSAAALDLDRLFGGADVADDVKSSAATVTVIDEDEAAPPPAAAPVAAVDADVPAGDAASDALPFDDAPIVPPPAARPPLAVRRATAEVPRNRPRTTRPAKPESLQFDPDLDTSAPLAGTVSTADTIASLMEMPSLITRVSAGAIDAALLIALDAAIVYLTLRVTGLSNSLEDLRVLPPIPFVGFLALLAFSYVATFTVAGGQTIGKMLMSLRVIGDDGRPIDAAGGMLRAAACMLVPITFGLSYIPALVTADHRALHDRLAGTRVVRES